jgi:hypothetical protein
MMCSFGFKVPFKFMHRAGDVSCAHIPVFEIGDDCHCSQM